MNEGTLTHREAVLYVELRERGVDIGARGALVARALPVRLTAVLQRRMEFGLEVSFGLIRGKSDVPRGQQHARRRRRRM